MNPKPIFKLFSPKGKAQTVVQPGVSTLIMRAVALSLLALTVCAQVVWADEPAASGQPSIEALPTGVKNDPDQDIGLLEFFSPGYGAQIVMSREAEVLPAMVKGEVDPDSDIGLLEFFTTPNKPGGPRAIEHKANDDISLDRPTPACIGYEAGGVLGLEDGLLGLRGVNGQKSLVASLLEDGTFSLYTVHRGSANYVMFIKTECL